MDSSKYTPLDPFEQLRSFTYNKDGGLEREDRTLDLALSDIYNYFYYKGFYNTVVTKGVNLLNMFITLLIFILFSSGINYDELFVSYNLYESFQKPRIGPFIGIFIAIYCGYWMYEFLVFVTTVRKMYKVRAYYKNFLDIDDNTIYTVKWVDIMSKLLEHFKGMDEHDIVQFIMRKKNFVIGLVNKDVLTFNISVPFVGEMSLLTRQLETNFKKIIFSLIYGKTVADLNEDLLKLQNRILLIKNLRRKFRAAAVIDLCLSPFKFIFLMLYYLFHYGQIFRTSPSSMCTYQWSLYAVWKFREFNELQHTLDNRLKKSYEPAEKYITRFNYQYRIAIAKCISFFSGSFITVLTLFTLYDDQFLFNGILFGDVSIVLTLAALGIIFKFAQSIIPGDNVVNEPEQYMKDIVNYTHYFPEKWRGNVHQYEIREEFSSLFEFKVTFIINEIFSVLTSPFMLWFYLAPQSEEIVDFLQRFIIRKPGIGYVCSFANFDFEKHGSGSYGNTTNNSSILLQSTNGKMEKSFLAFSNAYPNWKPSQTGRTFINNIHQTQIPSDSIFDLEQKFGNTIHASGFSHKSVM